MDEDKGLRGRVTRHGEDAIGKLAQDLLENPVVTGALSAAAETRERAMRAQEVAMSALNLPSASDVERLTRRLRAVSQRLEGIEDALDRLDERIEGAGSDSAAARRLSAIEAALARIEPAVLAAPRPARKTSASTRKAPGSSSTGSSSKKAPAARSRAR
jgi:predicted  nucleic acid-binding Zn-ribbon protein